MKNNLHYLQKILEFKLIDTGQYALTVGQLITIIIIIVLTKVILKLIKKALLKTTPETAEKGNLFALMQIISYVVWIIAIIIILDTIGLKITALLTGSAALLVGVGLGLQQTFNDFISGIILLFEGKTKVGDILEVDNDILILKNIGLRTTEGVDRDGISVFVPNSKIINNKVVNWTHQVRKTRFRIDVGVAYGSNIDLVIQLLKESALEHPEVTDKEKTEARLTDFGDSSLNFQLLFFSHNVFRIERIKSDIRKIINRKFEENNITIPFPQMDVYFSRKEKA
jgi:small-conductance mechanosensitive channel